MKKILTLFLVLLASAWLGTKIHLSAGYVLIAYRDWSIETTLWFAIAAMCLLFILCYWLLRLGKITSTLSHKFKTWLHNYRAHQAHIHTVNGLGELIKGYWGSAERKLITAARHSDMGLINYIAAAYAAQHQGAFERRNDYLRLAEKLSPKNAFAVELMQARLQFLSNQLEGALASLHHLKEINPKHPFVLQLLSQVYVKLNDWENLRTLLPLLHKRRILPLADLAGLEQQVYAQVLNNLTGKNSEELTKFWQSVPKYLQRTPAIVALYVDHLLSQKEFVSAENLLRKTLEHTWDESLVTRFGSVAGKNPVKQLALAESWLKQHASANLYLCLGRLCKKQMLWGKARYYFEQSVKLSPSRAAYIELGEIMEEQHDPTTALMYYKKGAKEILNSKF